ncbi:MAG: non-heme iron oxygenase ferredoxin subunit [Candidatus Melainabacteria bacterium]|jgi:3-phenylpropionate/trans-cinnamate dioxygenase ferredoxin subunit|nr:non-heme iron oxygenase ferredoxin subunit [Candidatus Melainabacteria bacterium]
MTGDFVKVANAADVPSGAARVFHAFDTELAICNVDGEYFCIADLCTHDGGPLGEGELIGNQIECPRHGARFDVRTGKALCLPAILPVPTYKVELRGEEIWVAAQATTSGAR